MPSNRSIAVALSSRARVRRASPVVVRPAPPVARPAVRVRDHRDTPVVRVRDRRDPPAARVRDHRDTPAARVRDHRRIEEVLPDIVREPIGRVPGFRPELVDRIRRVHPGVRGEPRDEVDAPISPVQSPGDEVLFEDPDEPGEKLYLPRYALVEEPLASGGARYAVRLGREGAGGLLSVRLRKTKAPAIADEAASARELPHEVEVLLRFEVGGGAAGSATKELTFQRLVPEEDGLRAELGLTTLAELGQVLGALKDPRSGAALVIERAARVALPVRRGRYLEVDRDFEQIAEPRPFAFDPALHPGVFQGVAEVPTGGGGLILRQAQHGERWHSYYQDEAEPRRIYYLPDAFRLARDPDRPGAPLMSVSFQSPDGSAEEMEAELQYVAAPWVDLDRLAEAAERLEEHVPGGAGEAVFEPLSVDRARLRLLLPGSTAGEERAEALVDVRSGVHDVLTLSLPEFQAVYDALFGAAALLRGEVIVELGSEGRPRRELIPFVARVDELAGEGELDEEAEPPPDREELWEAILDPTTPAEYVQTLEVSALPSWFEPSPDEPDGAPEVILVEFERGDTVQLRADRLSAEARVRRPVADLVLRRLDRGEYRYRVTVIGRRGRRSDEAWRTATARILFPELP